jgi:hypothetical protein
MLKRIEELKRELVLVDLNKKRLHKLVASLVSPN